MWGPRITDLELKYSDDTGLEYVPLKPAHAFSRVRATEFKEPGPRVTGPAQSFLDRVTDREYLWTQPSGKRPKTADES